MDAFCRSGSDKGAVRYRYAHTHCGPLPQAVGLHSTKTSEARIRTKRQKVKKWMDKTYPEISRQAQGEGAEIHWGDETGVKAEDPIGRGFAPKGQTPVRRHSGKKDQNQHDLEYHQSR